MLVFQPLQFDIIEEVAGGAIDFEKQEAVKLVLVGLAVGDKLLEDLPLVFLGRGFRDLVEADDFAILRL
jgi:hypothetical protein